MEIVVRALVMFLFLWVVTRAVGRSTLGELSTFELLLYVTLGDLVQQAVTQQDYSVTSGVLAISVFALLTVAPEVDPVAVSPAPGESTASPGHRPGRPAWTALRRNASPPPTSWSPRASRASATADVEHAVLEADGRISFFTYEGPEQDGAPDKPPEG